METSADLFAPLVGRTVLKTEVREIDLEGDEMRLVPVVALSLDDGSEFCFSADVSDRDSYYAFLATWPSFDGLEQEARQRGCEPRWLTPPAESA